MPATGKTVCIGSVATYPEPMPNLWSETVETHRRAVREAVLDTTADLVTEHGLRGVTMSQIAERTGIGRATLYKYFEDVEAILHAWHAREIDVHLEELQAARSRAGTAEERLRAVLETFAFVSQESHGHYDAELVGLLHRDEQVTRAQREVRAMLRDLLVENAKAGQVRDDVAPDELANYCLHSLAGARNLPSKAAARRLVGVTLAGLRPPASEAPGHRSRRPSPAR